MSADTPLTAADYAHLVRAELADLPADQLESIMDGLDAHLAEVVADGQPDLVAALGSAKAYAADLRAAAGVVPRAVSGDATRRFTWSRAHTSLALALGIGLAGLAIAVIARRAAGVAEVGEVLVTALAVGVAWWVARVAVERGGLIGTRRTVAHAALSLGVLCTAVALGAVVGDDDSGGGAPSTGILWSTTTLPFTSVPFPDTADFTSTMVQVANCSDQNGVAEMMSSALADAGFRTTDPTYCATEKMDTSRVIYDEGTVGAQSVAATLAGTLGLSYNAASLPIPLETAVWSEGSGVVLLLGNDLAGKTLDQIQLGGFAGTTTTGVPLPTAPGVQGALLFSVQLEDLGGFAEAREQGEQICVGIQLPADRMGSCYDRSVIESGNAWSSAQLGVGYTLLSGLMPSPFGWHVLVGDTAVFPDSNGFWYTALPQGVSEFTIVTDQGMIPVSLVGFSNGSGSTTTTVPSP